MTDYSAIPDELKERDQWLMWDSSADTPRRPHWAGDFNSVSWNDPDDWHSFEEAVEMAETRESWGIGYVFAAGNDDYPRGIYGALDLDGCADEDQKPKDWLPGLEPFFDADPYIEWSPSKTGLHIPLVGFEPPDWWRNVSLGDHEGVEAYGSKFFTFTGDQLDGAGDTVGETGEYVEEWLADVWEAVRGDSAPPRRDDQQEGLDDAAETNTSGAGNAREIANAVDALDAQRVADRTIVDRWNDDASTSEGTRAFIPTWAGANCNGRANIVNDECWNDTGGGGIGGPAVMAAIDLGEIKAERAHPSDVSGSLWWDAVDHLRDLGFDIPEYEGEEKTPKTAASEARETAETDGGPVATATTPTASPPSPDALSLRDRVQSRVVDPLDPPEDSDIEQIERRVAVDRFAQLLDEEYHFVRPRVDVRGWRDTLYVYDDDLGIYEPHAEEFIEMETERLLGPIADNQTVRELKGKLSRQNYAKPGELTSEPNRLVVENGILDLHTGDLDPLTPDEYHRTRIDVAYDPDATCERIDEFFHEIVEDHDVRTLYQLTAHALHKEYIAEKAAMLLGDGQNGKSVFLSLLREFLGEHNVSQRALQDFGENNFAANVLEGKLANLHPDMGDDIVRDLDVFKQLTGRDTLTADVKYEKPIQFENHATLIFAANRMPAMQEDTHALWRRWIYLNFPYTFRADDPEAKDPVPKRQLMTELTADDQLRGLLARAVEELNEWSDGRELFTETMGPEAVREKMKRASEPIYDFAAVCLETTENSDDSIPKSQVRKAYQEYAREENLPAMSENAFGEEILNIRDYPIEASQHRVDGQRRHVYTGIRFTPRARQLLGLDETTDSGQSAVTDGPPDKAQAVHQIVRQLEEQHDGPVPESMVVGRASADMTVRAAEQALEALKKDGRIYMASDDGVLTT